MIRLHLRNRARAVALVAASAAILAFNTASVPAAHSDPLFVNNPLVGMGSDTIQDVMNAFAGAAVVNSATNAPQYYTGLTSSVATGARPVVSWDAVDPNVNNLTPGCINEPKPGFGPIARPNGSSDGQKALSRAIDSGAWTKAGLACSFGTAMTGRIDFARSSSGPPSAFPGTALTFVPFAGDGVSYAYVPPADNHFDISALTTTQLQSLFGTGGVASTTGTITDGTDTIFACMVQAGSGTGKFWDKAMGNAGDGATSLQSAVNSGCNAGTNGPYEENGYNSWSTSAFIAGLTASQGAVIPFSAGQWIAQNNGAGQDRSNLGRCLGTALTTDHLGMPNGVDPIGSGRCTAGTHATQTPGATFYDKTVSIFARDLYVVIPTTNLTSVGGKALRSVFVGSGSAVCSATAQTTLNTFGFQSLVGRASQPCGFTTALPDGTLKSGLVS